MAVLLLDLDNTLWDREQAFLAWAHRKARLWAPDDPGAIDFLLERDGDGMRPRQAFFAAVRDRFALDGSVEELVADYRREIREAVPHVPDGVAERLRALSAGGWKLAIVTNGEADMQAAKIEQLGVAPLFDAICISGELGVRKPDARIFALAIERCGGDGAGAWMVGDGEVDVEGAHRAGLHSVWLHRGRTWTRCDFAPDEVADDLATALDVVANTRSLRRC
jgi:HAD superfamily hydrolase (TIGR01549 family)